MNKNEMEDELRPEYDLQRLENLDMDVNAFVIPFD